MLFTMHFHLQNTEIILHCSKILRKHFIENLSSIFQSRGPDIGSTIQTYKRWKKIAKTITAYKVLKFLNNQENDRVRVNNINEEKKTNGWNSTENFGMI